MSLALRRVGRFMGRKNNVGPLKEWIGVGSEMDSSLNHWLTPAEARALARKLNRVCDEIQAAKGKLKKDGPAGQRKEKP